MDRLTVKELPLSDRPYEKLEKYGAGGLSDAELLAIIIKSGNQEETSVQVAQRIIKENDIGCGLRFLNDVTINELMKIKGIGKVKAIQLKAVCELGRRINNKALLQGESITNPKQVADYFMEDMSELKQEILKVMILDTKNKLIKSEVISKGSLNKNIIEPREIFSCAIRFSGAFIIVAHNHPSGDPTPSNADIEFTKNIEKAGEIIGIDLLDHIVIGNGKYISMRSEGLF